MKKIEKIAAKDAARWLAAEMFYGEGAGTRRKLLQAELDSKYFTPGYYEAFVRAYEKLDMNKFAAEAIKERKRIDRSKMLSKNGRAILRGDNRNAVVAVITIAIVAHQLGYDKKAIAKAQELRRKARAKYAVWKLQQDPNRP